MQPVPIVASAVAAADHGHARDHRQLSFCRPGARRAVACIAMAYATLHFERDGHVGWLRLNRPDRLNAFTRRDVARAARARRGAARRPRRLRALVVIGEGRAFSSGIDTSVFAGDALDGDTLETDRDAAPRHDDPAVDAILQTQDVVHVARGGAVRDDRRGPRLRARCRAPARARVRPPRSSPEGTRLGLLEFKYGIIPDLGGTQRLPRLVGAGEGQGADLHRGADRRRRGATASGWSSRSSPTTSSSDASASSPPRIAAQPPLAVRGAKRAVQRGARPARRPRRAAHRGRGPGRRACAPTT